jgi:cyclase
MDTDSSKNEISRRDVLRISVMAGASLAFTSVLKAQFPPAATPAYNANYPKVPSWDTELRQLAPGVYGYIQAGGPDRDNVSISNAAVIVGDEGLLVVDALAAPIHARRFIAEIRKVTDKPFRHLVNTHHHADHINGNQYFAPVEIVSHPYCRQEVLKAVSGPKYWPKREGWTDGTDERIVLPATTTFESKMTYYVGNTEVQLIPMAPAHTWGDLVVYLPQHKILVAGDLAFFYVAPFCQNASPSKWIDSCRTIEAMDVDTIIPGHGPIGTKQNLAEMRGYLELLKVEAKKRYDAKMSIGQAAADIHMGKYENWIGPERIVMDTQRFYAEFSNTLTPDFDAAGLRKATTDYNAAIKTKT